MDTPVSKHKKFSRDAELFCARHLFSSDRDLYRIALYAPSYAPPSKRGAITALFLLLTEIEKIPSLVSEQTMGHLRLKWWYDSLSHNKTAPQNEQTLLLAALKTGIADGVLKPDALLALIEVMQEDLSPTPFNTAQDFIAYQTRKASAIAACAPCLWGENPEGSDHNALLSLLCLRVFKHMARSTAVLQKNTCTSLARLHQFDGAALENGAVNPAFIKVLKDMVAALPPIPKEGKATTKDNASRFVAAIAASATIGLQRLNTEKTMIFSPRFQNFGGVDVLRFWWLV